ncbi:MAG: hypothetical protein V7731_18445, partial [Amphritea sp.]
GNILRQNYATRYPCTNAPATSPCFVMIPGPFAAVMKLLRPQQNWQPEHLTRAATQNLTEIINYIDGVVQQGIAAPPFMAPCSPILDRVRPSPDIKGHLYQLLATCGWTSSHWLHKIRQPTLVLMGKDDPIVPAANGTILTKLLPNARMLTFRVAICFC